MDREESEGVFGKRERAGVDEVELSEGGGRRKKVGEGKPVNDDEENA